MVNDNGEAWLDVGRDISYLVENLFHNVLISVARLATPLVLPLSTLPPLTFATGHSPSQEAKYLAELPSAHVNAYLGNLECALGVDPVDLGQINPQGH